MDVIVLLVEFLADGYDGKYKSYSETEPVLSVLPAGLNLRAHFAVL